MYSALDLFPCDLSDLILIPGDEDFEAANGSSNSPTFEKCSVPFEDKEAEEWADIT